MRIVTMASIIFAIHFSPSVVPAHADDPAPTPKPLVLLYERDPWLMVIGSDSPVFALYDNGVVIYDTGAKDPKERFMTKVLTRAERDSLLARLPLGGIFPEFDQKMIEATTATDQPTNELHVFRGEEPNSFAVYGSLRGDSGDRKHAPPPFVEAFDQLTSYRPKDASPWLPEFIEVLFWPYEYSPEEPMAWPEGWPGLDDDRTQERGEGSFSVFLPASEFNAFLRLASSLGQRQAVLIEGRKCAVSYRMPFPAE